ILPSQPRAAALHLRSIVLVATSLRLRDLFWLLRSAALRQTCQITNYKRCESTECHIPGKRNLGPLPDIDVQCQPTEHTYNCSCLSAAPGQQSQKEYSQQSTVGNRGQSQSSFQHSLALAGSHGQPKQDNAPDDGCGA